MAYKQNELIKASDFFTPILLQTITKSGTFTLASASWTDVVSLGNVLRATTDIHYTHYRFLGSINVTLTSGGNSRYFQYRCPKLGLGIVQNSLTLNSARTLNSSMNYVVTPYDYNDTSTNLVIRKQYQTNGSTDAVLGNYNSNISDKLTFQSNSSTSMTVSYTFTLKVYGYLL